MTLEGYKMKKPIIIMFLILILVPTVSADSIWHYWAFNQTWYDEIPPFSHNWTTDQGTVTNITGKIGGAMYFDGSSNLDVSMNTFPKDGKDFSVILWVWFNNTASAFEQIITTETGNSALSIARLANGTFYAFLRDNGGDTIICISDDVLEKEKWYHAGVSFDNSAKKIELFINGEEICEKTSTSTVDIWVLSNALSLGASQGDGAFITGIMDSLEINNDTIDHEMLNKRWLTGKGAPYPFVTWKTESYIDINFSDTTNASLALDVNPGEWEDTTRIWHHLNGSLQENMKILLFGDNQRFEFIWEPGLQIIEELSIQDTDLGVTIQAQSETGNYIEDATIKIYQQNGANWEMVDQVITDGSGEAGVQITEGETYKFLAVADGCTHNAGTGEVEYIAPSRTDTIKLHLTCSDAIDWQKNLIQSCSGTIREPTECRHGISTRNVSTIIRFNFSYSNGTAYGYQATGNLIDYNFTINNETGNITIETYAGGILQYNYTIFYMDELDTPIRMTLTTAQIAWFKADDTRMKIFWIVYILLGVITAGIFESRIAKSGVHAFAVYNIFGLVAFHSIVSMISGIIVGIWVIYTLLEVIHWLK